MDCTQTYDIIIQAGQSNAEGCGRGPVDGEYVPSKDVFYLIDGNQAGYKGEKRTAAALPLDMRVEIAAEREDAACKIGDFSLYFARKYIEAGRLEAGRKLLIIRAAVSGTGFADKMWGMADPLYLRMLAMTDAALGLNPENRLIALLWHQGETDALMNPAWAAEEKYSVHRGNLTSLFISARERYNCPALPIVAGGFCDEWERVNHTACEPIISAMIAVLFNIGSAAFIETADLTSNNQATGDGDGIHFSRDALRIMGERYFKAFSTL